MNLSLFGGSERQTKSLAPVWDRLGVREFS